MPEIRSYFDCDANAPDVDVVDGREIAAFTTRSPSKIARNEDSLAWMAWPEALMLAIADGVGGQPGGAEASTLTVQLLIERFKNISQDQISLDVFREGVLDTLERANADIQSLGVGSGTTLTVVAVAHGQARAFSVGDSSVMVCGGKGKIKFLNTPHSPTGYAVAAGVLSENDALHHEERHLLSNLVGSQDMHIEIGPKLKLMARDKILVASDGLWDNMYLEEIVEVVHKGAVHKAAKTIQITCRGRMTSGDASLPGHADDLSFILARANTKLKTTKSKAALQPAA